MATLEESLRSFGNNKGNSVGVPTNADVLNAIGNKGLDSLKFFGNALDGYKDSNPIAYAAAGMIPGVSIPVNANEAVNHLKDKQYAEAALDALSIVASPIKALSKADYALAMYQYGHSALAAKAAKAATPGLVGLTNDGANLMDNIVNK
jgi:hypothetical protein